MREFPVDVLMFALDVVVVRTIRVLAFPLETTLTGAERFDCVVLNADMATSVGS